MESSPPDAPTEPNTQQPVEFSPADRIKQLNQIDKEISSLLTTASAAITTLSSPKPSQSTFKTQSAQYHSSVHSIVSALKRQIYALEQADIPLPAILTTPAGSAPAAASSSSASGLDIGALSGRSDSVGKKMDQELWKKAREMVEAKNAEDGEKLDLRMDIETKDAA
ncbi:hypothetical protein TWF481_008459 [Arthrobotrys musiformis]|uniref:Mediator of RNA polymerase II transcription subunit 11 n=1 Tax=Arthrobotrys musiformis TaxID=47236 RepID=A0AAV9W777_9PEZI